MKCCKSEEEIRVNNSWSVVTSGRHKWAVNGIGPSNWSRCLANSDFITNEYLERNC
ncbi:hypothetical protein Hanom_Chr07g00588931 [Helianthus anomalus]